MTLETPVRVGQKLWSGLLDFVYPPHCLVCDTEGRPVICDECAARFEPLPNPTCERCGRPLSVQGDEPLGPNEALADPDLVSVLACRYCALARETGADWAFDRAFAAGAYYGALRYAIHQLKFNKREFLGKPLGAHLANRAIADALIPRDVLTKINLVAALPMHAARERQRGFNQARLIAAPVADMHGVPLLPARALRRIRKTHTQVGLSGNERLANVGAELFAADTEAVQGKSILLIDDVMTTGATVSACAQALKNAGASSVYVLVLAAGA